MDSRGSRDTSEVPGGDNTRMHLVVAYNSVLSRLCERAAGTAGRRPWPCFRRSRRSWPVEGERRGSRAPATARLAGPTTPAPPSIGTWGGAGCAGVMATCAHSSQRHARPGGRGRHAGRLHLYVRDRRSIFAFEPLYSRVRGPASRPCSATSTWRRRGSLSRRRRDSLNLR
jgi:hypothetical protein